MATTNLKQLGHGCIAGLIALIIHAAVALLIVGKDSTWHVFGPAACTDAIQLFFCFTAGLVKVMLAVLFVGMPLAVICSAFYLRYARFSLVSAIGVAIGANALAGILIVSLGSHWYIPLAVIAGIIPLSYIAAAAAFGSKPAQ